MKKKRKKKGKSTSTWELYPGDILEDGKMVWNLNLLNYSKFTWVKRYIYIYIYYK